MYACGRRLPRGRWYRRPPGRRAAAGQCRPPPDRQRCRRRCTARLYGPFRATRRSRAAYEAPRRAGALAPGQFGWLKLVDRRLWYALHLLGFETEGAGRYLHPNPRVEALGARDHWSVERIAGVPVSRPDLDRAVEALQKAALARLSGAGN